MVASGWHGRAIGSVLRLRVRLGHRFPSSLSLLLSQGRPCIGLEHVQFGREFVAILGLHFATGSRIASIFHLSLILPSEASLFGNIRTGYSRKGGAPYLAACS